MVYGTVHFPCCLGGYFKWQTQLEKENQQMYSNSLITERSLRAYRFPQMLQSMLIRRAKVFYLEERLRQPFWFYKPPQFFEMLCTKFFIFFLRINSVFPWEGTGFIVWKWSDNLIREAKLCQKEQEGEDKNPLGLNEARQVHKKAACKVLARP